MVTDVLIIEDNREIAGLLRDFLEKAGYSCVLSESGEDGLAYLKENDVRIVLLDMMLPGMDGISVCDEIHRSKNLPILILSARTEKEDKLSALSLGADDYIEKPFDIDLLTAKIAALLRRRYGNGREIIDLGDIRIDEAGRTVFLNDTPVSLTAKEFDLLLLLSKNQNKALRKGYLFDSVWGSDSFSEPSTLTVHIKWLREKLEKDPKNPKRILTVWGVGYKLAGVPDEEV